MIAGVTVKRTGRRAAEVEDEQLMSFDCSKGNIDTKIKGIWDGDLPRLPQPRGDAGCVVLGKSTNGDMKQTFVFFRFLQSRVAPADFPSPFGPIFCILLRHFNHCHVLFHRIHKPPFMPSPFPLTWQLHPQNHYPNIPIIFPSYMSKPHQSWLSYFLSKPSKCLFNAYRLPYTLVRYHITRFGLSMTVWKHELSLCKRLTEQ